MQTRFSPEQLKDPRIREADSILRKCVHCGFCTATCPTYLLLGDELDGPRGRIYLVKDMLEGDTPPSPDIARHIDRCLTCLSCMTTCPSGVDYDHLLAIGREVLEGDPRSRPAVERFWRGVLDAVVPHPSRFALALRAGRIFRPLAGLLERLPALRPAASMLRMAGGGRIAKPVAGAFLTRREGRGRVALLQGCAQSVLGASVNRATISLLNRCGVDVVIPREAGCCGALTHHMGREERAREMARVNIAAWERADVDAVVVNASGCGVTVKDYGHLLTGDPKWALRASRISERTKDVHEYLATLELPPLRAPRPLKVVFHAPCSLTHGLKLADVARQLLENAGFEVLEPAEGHICCGAAGVYSVLQPDMSLRLRERKAGHLEATGAEVVASANFGCIHHLAEGTDLPVVHVVELLEWAAGGDMPPAMRDA